MTSPSPSAVNGEAPPIVSAGRYPRYPDYRESGVGWLGEIPAHWQVKRTRHVARLESRHTPSRNNSEYWQDCNIPWFTLADVWQIREGGKDVITETKEQISEMGLAHSAARLLPKGTVILSRTASVGFSAIAGVDLATTQDYVNWVCKSDLRPEYLLLVFRSMNSEFQRRTMGSTHRTIYMPDVRRFSTPLPTIEEQENIVSFVNIETAKIDALVAKKERLIELLQEKRTALITRAVTKGIDPDAPMKDSGVEWLDKIPAYWQALRLFRLTPSDRGIMYGIVLPGPNVQVGVPIVKGGDVSSERLRVDRLNRTSFEIEARYVRSRLRGGDLVYAIRGSIGDVAIVPDELEGANLTQDAARVAYTDETHGRWLLYALKSLAVFAQLESGALGATIRGINIRDFTSVPTIIRIESTG